MKKQSEIIEIEKNDRHIFVVYTNILGKKEAVFETNLPSIVGMFESFINSKYKVYKKSNDENLYKKINLDITNIINLVIDILSYKEIYGIYFKLLKEINDNFDVKKEINAINFKKISSDHLKQHFLVDWRIMQLLRIGLENHQRYIDNKEIYLSDKFVNDTNCFYQ